MRGRHSLGHGFDLPVRKVSVQSGEFPVERMPCIRKQFMHTHCHENNLRASSGKFLGVEFCRPEIFDFLCPFLQLDIRGSWGS